MGPAADPEEHVSYGGAGPAAAPPGFVQPLSQVLFPNL